MSERIRPRLRTLALAGAVLLASIPLAAVVAPSPAAAAAPTYKVNTTKDLPWAAGVCPKKVKSRCSLRAAIAQANMDGRNDLINVPSGHYTLTVVAAGDRTTPTGSNGFTDLNINRGVRIVGAGAGKTVVDGNGTYRVFTLGEGADVSISKLTITGGGESMSPRFGAGGGIEVDLDTGLTLTDAVVSGNHVTGFGGGIDNHGQATLKRVQVTGNASGNPDSQGSGAFEGTGGGISNSMDMAIIDSTVDGNDGQRGAGVNNASELFLTNSTVSGNTARNSGGGIRNVGGLVQAKFSTIADNFADSTPFKTKQTNAKDFPSWGGENGGGVVNLDGGTMEIGGVILADNVTFNTGGPEESPDCYAPSTVTSARNNLIGVLTSACAYADILEGSTIRFDFFGGLGDPFDPQLGPLQVNSPGRTPTHALTGDSDAIDGANGSTEVGPANNPISPDDWFLCDATDQRGAHRPVGKLGFGPICDIGAYELQ